MSDKPKTMADQDKALAVIAPKKRKLVVSSLNLDLAELKRSSAAYPLEDLEKSAINSVAAIRNGEELVNLTFTEDPTTSHYTGLYKPKIGLIPDHMLKLLARQDDLVASILNARSNHVSAFGRELEDRFSTGFRIEPRRAVTADWDEDRKEDLLDRIDRVEKLIGTCGHVSGIPKEKKQSLSKFMYLQARNGLLFGRFATEITHIRDTEGKEVPHSFRAVDAGTIYQAQPHVGEQGDQIRQRALQLLEQINDKKIDVTKARGGEYRFYQVINNIPRQGYESHEMVVTNLYPVTDVELAGYPMTPADTVLAAITTHINITTHNKLYFQNGRAARGIVVIKSDDNDQDYVDAIRQHFQATSNGVEKCLAGSSLIRTRNGEARIDAVLGSELEKGVMIWTGTDFQAATVYRTKSPKRLVRMTMDSGALIESSPDHKFMAIGSNGAADWKLRSELEVGDLLLCDYTVHARPYSVGQYGVLRIRSLEETQEFVQMYDVEVYDPRHQFTVSGVVCHNSFRVPVFGIGKDDEMQWTPVELQAGRDMEFQYLSDSNARVILSAFQMSPEELAGYAHLSRGTNSQALSECMDPTTQIVTNKGLQSLAAVLGDAKEASTMLWSGTAWREGRVFRTGPKKLMETKVGSLKVKTSPDHRFRVIGTEGEPVWKQQKDLTIEDYVLVNAKPVVGNSELVPSFRGKRLTPEVMEILGWMTGDGTLVESGHRTGGQLILMYHHERERDIWDSHAKALAEFGLEVKHTEREVTEEEAQKIMATRGFKSVAKTRIRNTVYDTDFVRWLFGMGFRTSTEGKVVPDILHVMPTEYRQAFLRGLFSADGHVPTTHQIILTAQNEAIREGARQLLLGLGIRTTSCQGILRASFGNEKSFSYKLFLRDKEFFWQQIGFAQAYKNERRKIEKWSLDSAPAHFMRKYAQLCADTAVWKSLPKRERDNIKGVADGKRRGSLKYLKRSMETCGLPIPLWFTDYHFEAVTEINDLDQTIEMVDIEVFDNDHAFIANGIVLHNSNSEFKLEAARDTGIRPLMGNFQDFLNNEILPLFDPEVAKYCTLKLYGLDSDSPEREATRLGQDQPLHMNYNEILERVEKDPVDPEMGGEFPLNPSFQQVIANYMTFGEIIEKFMGKKGASADPALSFYQNPSWFQYQEMLQQQQQMQMQAQSQQGGQGGAPQGQPQGQQGGAQQMPPEAAQSADGQDGADVGKDADQALAALGKAEAQMTPQARQILGRHRNLVKTTMEAWKRDSAEALAKVLSVAKKS